ncbi:5'/3'-nucleotidase SurE [Yinghuangia seranimata]|uniref:5'/3'-nucleotidase SurE n=1 Tax=Yinghuangia seranimata TaxID=408067 RepID=UPI00248CA780|nr:5'/3'-nucleotidase SurE [Yinghuangia seranimata]MDI2131945.1 5'/3'-nucleotidase SurE [Yinghuangia seranimata]
MKLKNRYFAVPAVLGAGALVFSLTGAADAAQPQASAPSTAGSSIAGMKILLSNDDSMQMARPDGSDGRGLYEVRRALCAAGADVVVMAPWQFMSGAGTSATGGGALTVSQRTVLPAGFENDCAGAPSKGVVFGVCKGAAPCTPTTPSATPADTVRLGVRGGLAAKVGWTNGPDLVVTGANSGPNVASVTNDSGTLGAAIAGIDNGKPAIALSAGFDMAAFKVTEKTYRAFADFLPGFVGDLKKRNLLTDKYVTSVNYPNAVDGVTPKPVWTEIGTETVVATKYTLTGDTFTIGMGDCAAPGTFCRPEEKRNADWTALNNGNITVAAVTSDRTYTGLADKRLEVFVRTGF